MADAISARPTELILGYTTPLIARPGGRVEVRVSSSAGRYDASLVRLLSAGPGDGVRHELVRDLGSRGCRRHERAIRTAGSSVAVGPSETFRELGSFTVSLWVWPSLLTETPQAVLGTLTADGTAGWAVVLDRERGVGLRVATGAGIESAYDEVPLPSASGRTSSSASTATPGGCGSRGPRASGGPHTAEAAVRHGRAPAAATRSRSPRPSTGIGQSAPRATAASTASSRPRSSTRGSSARSGPSRRGPASWPTGRRRSSAGSTWRRRSTGPSFAIAPPLAIRP